jgi:undecaprenyl-diphosphatase
MSDLSYPQAVIIGALQGVTELFPVSSLGHSVLVPAWIGGSWKHLVGENSTGSSGNSPYLAFVVGLHVATAIALLVHYRGDWVRIISAFFVTLRTRKIETSSQRLAWLIIAATVPVGIIGLVLEHQLRSLFAKPLAAAIFLTVNGVILFAGERLRRASVARSLQLAGAGAPALDGEGATEPGAGRRLDTLSYREAGVIGAFQSLALLAGISRSGITMVGGLLRGLDHEDAAKFAFLLATPVILAAGVLKLPTLAGSAGDGIRGQALVGAIVAGLCAYVAVRFLERYFSSKTLTPFAVYCLVGGLASVIRFA